MKVLQRLQAFRAIVLTDLSVIESVFLIYFVVIIANIPENYVKTSRGHEAVSVVKLHASIHLLSMSEKVDFVILN